MRKILVLNDPSKEYSVLFEEYGQIIHTPEKVEDCDLVVFTGGSDVNPNLYGDKQLDTTIAAPARDVK